MKIKNQNRVVMGIFQLRDELEAAVMELRREGFRNADLAALLPSATTTKEFAHVNSTKLPEGASIGSGAGALVGGILGLLAGLGSLAIPGVGPFVAAGPLMSALAGIGVGGVAGALSGALIGMGLPEYEARRYEGFVQNGGLLLSAHCDDERWILKARQIFERYGASEVSSSVECSSDSPAYLTGDIPRAAV